jgi:hypothetical protein
MSKARRSAFSIADGKQASEPQMAALLQVVRCEHLIELAAGFRLHRGGG